MKSIAIVEDEPGIRDNYADALRKQGYRVETFGTVAAAQAAFERRLPDLALLDVGLEDDPEGGFELCRMLRARAASVPIMFLTARDNELDAISGLRLGADDYLTKDISLPHLCARIAALFRRMDALLAAPEAETLVERGPLTLDMNRFTAHWHDQPVDLGLTEFWMVHALALHPGHVRSRTQLMEDARIVVDEGTVTSHIKRIRAKFIRADSGFAAIDTVYGMGYRWVTPPPAAAR